MHITVYSKPNCPQCEQTKAELDRLGLSYEAIDLSRAPAVLERLVAAGWRQAPVVESDGGNWSGFDAERLRSLAATIDA